MICALLIDPDDSIDFADNGAKVRARLSPAGGQGIAPLPPPLRADHIPTRAAHRRPARRGGPCPPISAAQPGAARPSDAALVRAGYRQIIENLKAEKAELELLVLLFAHTGAVNTKLIDEGVAALLDDPALDSTTTVSPYDRCTPRLSRNW